MTILNNLKYTEPEYARSYHNKIIHVNGYDYFTDGNFFARVKGNSGEILKENCPDFGKINLDYDPIKGVIFLDDFKKYPACNWCDPETDKIVHGICHDCGGTGTKYCCHCENEYPCYECDEDGQIIDSYPTKACPECYSTGLACTGIEFLEKQINIRYIKYLMDRLPNVKFYPTESFEGIVFSFDGGIGGLMGMAR